MPHPRLTGKSVTDWRASKAQPAAQTFLGQMADSFRRRAAQVASDNLDLLQWADKFLKHYFFRSLSPLHMELARQLEATRYKRGTRTNIVAPRGNAKTTWSQAKVLKAICEGSERYILLLADTERQAIGLLKTIRLELESNELLRATYPQACRNAGTWNDGRIETANCVCVEALGTGQKVRGLKFRQWRPTLILGDDLQNDTDILSPTTREQQLSWFYNALLPCGDSETSVIVCGTMLHRECIVGKLCTDPNWKTIMFQAIRTWPTNMDLWDQWEGLYIGSPTVKNADGTQTIDTSRADTFYVEHKTELHEGAVVLWPEKEDLYALMKMRAGKHTGFNAEKQNDPRDPSKAEFKEEWLADDHSPRSPWYEIQDLNAKLECTAHTTIIFGDVAKGRETKRHDYSSLVLLHMFKGEQDIYVECELLKIPVNEFVDRMLEWHEQRKCDVIAFEDEGFQYLLKNEFDAKFELRRNLKRVPVIPVATGKINKETRIKRLALPLSLKKFKFRRFCSHTNLLLQQLLDFPHGDHDDGPDSLEGAYRTFYDVIPSDGEMYEGESDLPETI